MHAIYSICWTSWNKGCLPIWSLGSIFFYLLLGVCVCVCRVGVVVEGFLSFSDIMAKTINGFSRRKGKNLRFLSACCHFISQFVVQRTYPMQYFAVYYVRHSVSILRLRKLFFSYHNWTFLCKCLSLDECTFPVEQLKIWWWLCIWNQS